MGRSKAADNPDDWRTVEVFGRECQVIEDIDTMDPFFISVVSSGNHWIFLSSHGGITAGRRNADHALFPYYTEDKVVDMAETTGSQTIIRKSGHSGFTWEPFSIRGEGRFALRRNLYKSLEGDTVVFEEVNTDLKLAFRYVWMSSNRYGVIRQSELANLGKTITDLQVLDGIRNILPADATAQLQNEFSCLMDAYKASELHEESGLALYSLSSVLTDKAEPNEALRATVVWSPDASADTILLSEDQVPVFRRGEYVFTERETRGRRGGYYLRMDRKLEPESTVSWHIAADVDKTQSEASSLIGELARPSEVLEALKQDIDEGTTKLRGLVGLADGFQLSSSRPVTAHHYANTLFNIMRGGIFADGYHIDRDDFLAFLELRNRVIAAGYRDVVSTMPAGLSHHDLVEWASGTGDPQVMRLTDEYLPLNFSRRHGDPSRPWNRFSIELEDSGGRKSTNYQGNWRDIFQNWEALGLSYPMYVPSMAAKFLNAVTADGYNPYRVTREGIEWEVPEPQNPWSNIGYWGDHQVIYLLKLLELWDRVEPGELASRMDREAYSHADVPYRIKPYDEIVKDPRNTILFDDEKNDVIVDRSRHLGSDGRLLQDPDGSILLSSLLEKILIILLAKLSNLVPGGGIWMNTQRPEWNDANNALVGPGLSMVTLCYIRRFAGFLKARLTNETEHPVDSLLGLHFREVLDILSDGEPADKTGPEARRSMMDSLGSSATRYRESIYRGDFGRNRVNLATEDIRDLLDATVRHADVSLAASLRSDGLYHSYNLLVLGERTAEVRHLYEMLEGQVAVLSAGFLDAEAALVLLDSLRHSALYRKDQNSFMLYPDRQLPGFLEKNLVPKHVVEGNNLLRALIEAGSTSIIVPDPSGDYRFNADARNAGSLAGMLEQLGDRIDHWKELVRDEKDSVLGIYENVFDHGSFTGRSGTFFAYEGLGSIYWHMVSKLLLAVQENYVAATGISSGQSSRLLDHYYGIRAGLSCHKTAREYGAFVTDPYSHTPSGKGARQPGMTGQVKEELLTRLGELGLYLEQGCINFRPGRTAADEILARESEFTYVSATGESRTMTVPAGGLAFTFCGVPICYLTDAEAPILIRFIDGNQRRSGDRNLSRSESRSVFRREGQIEGIVVALSPDPQAG